MENICINSPQKVVKALLIYYFLPLLSILLLLLLSLLLIFLDVESREICSKIGMPVLLTENLEEISVDYYDHYYLYF